MLQVARLAPNLLRDATGQVERFLGEQLNEDGGFKDRSGDSDLYYTVFGIEALRALRADPPADRIRGFLETFGDGSDLDLVHLTCLARCWANLPDTALPREAARRVAQRVEAYRSDDGGYNPASGSSKGTVYHGFLALGAYQDLDAALPNPAELAGSLQRLQTDDGAYSNDPMVQTGTTTVTAAAATLMRHLDVNVPSPLGDWLLARCHPDGGFLASPSAPMPDLLSTAAALHALAGMHVDIGAAKEPCLNFLDSLWTGRAFCGFWADDAQDCEYTYYALLALGHLSL